MESLTEKISNYKLSKIIVKAQVACRGELIEKGLEELAEDLPYPISEIKKQLDQREHGGSLSNEVLYQMMSVYIECLKTISEIAITPVTKKILPYVDSSYATILKYIKKYNLAPEEGEKGGDRFTWREGIGAYNPEQSALIIESAYHVNNQKEAEIWVKKRWDWHKKSPVGNTIRNVLNTVGLKFKMENPPKLEDVLEKYNLKKYQK